MKKVRHKSLKALRKEAWQLISEYVRRSELGICFTCGTKGNWKDMDCGHYIHKNCLDFTIINLHCQCTRCNRFLHGNLGVYAEKMMRLYGQPIISALREKSKNIKKFSIEELELTIKNITTRLKELECQNS